MDSQKLKKYIFFSFCSSFELLGSHRISSPQKRSLIVHSFSTRRTHFDYSKTIEITTSGREETYRQDTFDYSKPSKFRLLKERKPIAKDLDCSVEFLLLRLIRNSISEWSILNFCWMMSPDEFLSSTHFYILSRYK